MHRETRRYFKIAVNLLVAFFVLIIVGMIIPRTLMFFMPFLIGWIISLIANPLVKFLEEKLKVKRKPVSGMVIVLVLAGVILLSYLVIAKLASEVVGFVNDLPNLWRSLEGDMLVISRKMNGVYERLPADVKLKLITFGDGINIFVKESLGKLGTPTVEAVGSFAKNIPSILISTIMCILSAYFFTAEKDYMARAYRRIVPISLQTKWNIVYTSLKRAVGGYLKAQLKIEMWIYLLLLIGLMLLKIEYAVLIAFGIAILDFFPFFGTGAVMLPWAIVKIMSSDYTLAIGLLIIWGVSQLVRQIIQPKIVGDSIGMPAIPTLFLLYIGYRFAGVIGMIIAVPIGIIIYNMYQSGIFETTRISLCLLVKCLNDFRRYDKEDMMYLEQDTDKAGVGGKKNENQSNRL